MATEMLSVITPKYSPPSGYELAKVARPVVTEPTDVLIQIHASSINPIDVKKASGALKAALKDDFPYQIGFDASGVVTQVGEQVTKFKVGDEVFARLPEENRGAWSEYAKCTEYYVAHKPKSLSHGEAASLPLIAVTALQAFAKYKGSLEGKTVFVPAGLSGTGSCACQLAKNVFKAGKVITTVSTAKVAKVPELLGEGVVDQIIDYTKTDPNEIIPRGSVDFIFDTTGDAMHFLSLMKPSTSTIVSIATMPSGTQLQSGALTKKTGKPQLPAVARIALDLADWVRRVRAGRWGVEYEYLLLEANGKDLGAIGGYVEEKKLVPVVGTTVKLNDIEKVREACTVVYQGKGAIGKAVIEVI